MKDAAQLKQDKQQRYEQMGKPKLAADARSPDGRTV